MLQVFLVNFISKGLSLLKELCWLSFLPYGEEMQWFVFSFTWIGATHGLLVNSFLANLVPHLNVRYAQGKSIKGITFLLAPRLMLCCVSIFLATAVVLLTFGSSDVSFQIWFYIILIPYICLNPLCQLARVERSLTESAHIDSITPVVLTLSLLSVPALVVGLHANLLLALASGFSIGIAVEAMIHYWQLGKGCAAPVSQFEGEPFFLNSIGYIPGAAAFNSQPAAEVSVLTLLGFSVEIIAYYYAMKMVNPLYSICATISNYLTLPSVFARKNTRPIVDGFLIVALVSFLSSLVLGILVGGAVPGLDTWLLLLWLLPPLWYLRHSFLAIIAGTLDIKTSQSLNVFANIIPLLGLYPFVWTCGPVGVVYSLVLSYIVTGVILWKRVRQALRT